MAKTLGLERTVFLGPKGQGLEGLKSSGIDPWVFWSNLHHDLTHGSLKKTQQGSEWEGKSLAISGKFSLVKLSITIWPEWLDCVEKLAETKLADTSSKWQS